MLLLLLLLLLLLWYLQVSDGIIAPGFEPEALEILRKKKKGAYIILQADPEFAAPDLEYRVGNSKMTWGRNEMD